MRSKPPNIKHEHYYRSLFALRSVKAVPRDPSISIKRRRNKKRTGFDLPCALTAKAKPITSRSDNIHFEFMSVRSRLEVLLLVVSHLIFGL